MPQNFSKFFHTESYREKYFKNKKFTVAPDICQNGMGAIQAIMPFWFNWRAIISYSGLPSLFASGQSEHVCIPRLDLTLFTEFNQQS